MSASEREQTTDQIDEKPFEYFIIFCAYSNNIICSCANSGKSCEFGELLTARLHYEYKNVLCPQKCYQSNVIVRNESQNTCPRLYLHIGCLSGLLAVQQCANDNNNCGDNYNNYNNYRINHCIFDHCDHHNGQN